MTFLIYILLLEILCQLRGDDSFYVIFLIIGAIVWLIHTAYHSKE